MSIRIILADDHLIVREGLRSLLKNSADIQVVAETSNGREAINLTREHCPDLVVMDLSMPELNGIEATRRITAEMKEVRVLALSMHSSKRFVIEALKAGASGYMLKECAAEELLTAIGALAAGEKYLSPKVSGLLVDYYQGSDKTGGAEGNLLTSREREVLQLIAEGNSTKQIAFDLKISVKTIETHRLQMMRKLKMNGVAELTRFAIREGMICAD